MAAECTIKRGITGHASNPRTWETEAGGLL